MKDTIRKEILFKRDSLAPEQINSLSSAITDRLLNSPVYNASANIMAYLSFRSEVTTDLLITHSLNAGKRVFVPICIPATRALVLSEIRSLDDLENGYYGIRQPKKDKLFIADRNLLDMVVVPGAVFDRKGNRIGYGAGYYDRFFQTAPKDLCKVALAYSLQLLDSIPAEPHDVTMDYIITEKEIADCR